MSVLLVCKPSRLFIIGTNKAFHPQSYQNSFATHCSSNGNHRTSLVLKSPVRNPSNSPFRSPSPQDNAQQMLKILEDCDDVEAALKPFSGSLRSSRKITLVIKDLKHNPKLALKFFHWTRQQISLTKGAALVHYAMMGVLLSHDGLDEAIEDVLTQMKRQGHDVRVGLAGQLITHFGRVNVAHKSVEVFNEVRKKHLLLKACPCNRLFDVLVKDGCIDEAANLANEMFKAHLMPRRATLGALFGILLDENRLIEAKKIAVHMINNGFRLDGLGFKKLIDALCKSGEANKALEIVEFAKTKGVFLDAQVLNLLLIGLGNSGEFGRINLLLAQMIEMEIDPDIGACRSLIQSVCKLGAVCEAEEFLERIRDANCSLYIIVYNGIVDCLCELGRLDEAIRLLSNLRHFHSLNVVTINALIGRLCKVGRSDEAWRLVERMEVYGCFPDAYVYNSCIDGFCKAAKRDEAYGVFVQMIKAGRFPSAATINIVIDQLSKDCRMDMALECFDKMSKMGLQPDEIVWNSMVCGLYDIHEVEKAKMLVMEVPRKGSRISAFATHDSDSEFPLCIGLTM